jgi:hypothetical protein
MTLKGGIAHVRCEYSKPLLTLIFAILILITSIAGSIAAETAGIFIGGLIVSVILFLVYHFNKSIAIVVETRGGTTCGLKFKPSFIENVDVNLDKANKVIEVINELIVKAQE